MIRWRYFGCIPVTTSLLMLSCGADSGDGSTDGLEAGGSSGSAAGGATSESTMSGGSTNGSASSGGAPSAGSSGSSGLGGDAATGGGPAGGGSPGGETGSSAGSSGSPSATGGSAGSSGSPNATGGVAGTSGSANATGGVAGSSGSAGRGGAPSAGPCSGGFADGRLMECLDRGVVAVASGEGAFVSWRLLGTDPENIGFNLYREDSGSSAVLVCTSAGSAPTSCFDGNPGSGASYFVRSVLEGVEGEPSGSALLFGRDYVRIPLAPAPDAGAYVHLAWVGDLDGDGEYDVVVDRISAGSPLVDGYDRHGQSLWRLDTGPLGVDQAGIEGGAATISNGHNDGLTVFDFDSDGLAEVAIKTANGFVFGDGQRLVHDNDADQFVSIVDGLTGAELARAPLPDVFVSDGPLQCHFGAGYFDGTRPSVMAKCKNRVGNGGFNLVATAFDFDGATLSERWRHVAPAGREPGADFHQIRILDVEGDGRDELVMGGYVVDDDGSVLYSLAGAGVVHGDRFHITDMDPGRPGLEGWGIQQDNPSGLETYYYDAATGEMLETYYNPGGAGGDLGRGNVADLYPDSPGMEYWSFNGLYSASTGALLVPEIDKNVPWPSFSMQWDGDTGTELLDNDRVGDWDIAAQSRNDYTWRRTFEGLVQARGAIPFYGDILGDWREEALLETADHAELRIYTTTHETDVRLYTLVHNPQYRNSLTVHGYKQSHHVDYFLGHSMAPPPQPRIRLVGGQ